MTDSSLSNISGKQFHRRLCISTRASYGEMLRRIYREIPERYRTREHRTDRHRLLKQAIDYHRSRRDHFIRLFGRNARSLLR